MLCWPQRPSINLSFQQQKPPIKTPQLPKTPPKNPKATTRQYTSSPRHPHDDHDFVKNDNYDDDDDYDDDDADYDVNIEMLILFCKKYDLRISTEKIKIFGRVKC